MTGEELRNVLFVHKIEIKGLAQKLGVSPQSLSQTFNAADVKSGMLEKIADVLGKDMSFFYPMKETYQQTTNNTKVHARNAIGGNGTVNEGTGNEVVLALLEQNRQLMDALFKKEK